MSSNGQPAVQRSKERGGGPRPGSGGYRTQPAKKARPLAPSGGQKTRGIEERRPEACTACMQQTPTFVAKTAMSKSPVIHLQKAS